MISPHRISLERISFEAISSNNLGSPNLSRSEMLPSTRQEAFITSHGMRVTPSYLEFTPVFEGEKFNKGVEITNVSAKSIEFYIKQPISMAFTLIDDGTKISLAPGLSVKKTVVFEYRPDTLLSCFFTIRIKDAAIEIPVYFKRVHTRFAVTPACLDFGKVDVGSPLASKVVKMENLASFPAQYKIAIGPNENYIQVVPCKGLIRPNETHILRIQFYPSTEGQINHVITVMPPSSNNKTKGDWRQKNDIFCTIMLQADIIKPSLVAIHKNVTGEFTLCDFPLTFAGTTRYDTVIVDNASAQNATFVVLGEMMNSLFELKSARRINSNYKMFSVEPTEGRIGPFKKTVLKITYKPAVEYGEKGWKFVENSTLQKSHFSFFKIVMVEVKDHNDFDGAEYEHHAKIHSNNDDDDDFSDDSDWYNSKDNFLSYDSENFRSSQGFRLCLHGLFTTAVLEVSPEQLVFEDLQLGREASRQVTVINQSLLKLGYRAVMQSYVRVEPKVMFIEAGTSMPIEVAVCVHALGAFKRVLKLEYLSMKNVTDSRELKVIGEAEFIIKGNVKADTKKPQPKLNLGITPKITHEVGFLSEEVTYGTKNVPMPANAIVAVKGQLPRIYNASDVVAFPNDMPRSLKAQYPDKVFRSIFTGKERYAPPIDCCLTYTELEKLKSNKHNEFWLNYVRNENRQKGVEMNMKLDYGLTIKDLQRLNSVAPLGKVRPYAKRVIQSQQIKKCSALSPLELYNIQVNPKMLNFYMVAVDSDCEETMHVENLNYFAVTMRVISANASIRVNGDDQLKINPHDSATFSIVLRSPVLGVFNGLFKYVVNEKHVFEMAVAAEIVEKFLEISTQEIRFVEPKYNPFYMWSEYITLTNHLKSDTEFNWISKSSRCFDIEPKKGTVPSNGELNCAITSCPSVAMESSCKISLLIDRNPIDALKCSSGLGRAHITFINPLLNLGSVPLNLKVIAKSVLFNATYRKVPFKLLAQCNDEKLMKGVSVSPNEGFIEPRGDVVFAFTFTLLRIGAIDLRFSVESEGCLANLKVVGQVVFPKIKITPERFQVLRVPCFTQTTCMLTAENESTAMATVSFLIDQYYHFKITVSSEYGKSSIIDHFTLLPGDIKKFYLHFFPTDLATHEFYLPVVINNIIGPPDIKCSKSLTPGYFISQYQDRRKTSGLEKLPCTLVLCTVAPPHLNFSKVFVNCFGDDKDDYIVITNTQDTTAYVGLQLSATNSLQNGFQMKCLTPPINVNKREQIYTYEILPGDSIKLLILFNPSEKGFYEEKLLVFYTLDRSEAMDSSTAVQPYTELTLHGKTSGSLITSDSVIYFPPTPLDVKSLRKFTITKYNCFEEQEMNLKVDPLDLAIEQFLTVSYSDETLIVKRKASLQIALSFKSNHAISFKTQLIFRDTFGCQVAVTVIATADNCLLTTHAFSTLKYKAQMEAENDNNAQTESIQYNHIEFIKRSISRNSLLDEGFTTKSVVDRRVIKSQTSLRGSVSQVNVSSNQTIAFMSPTKMMMKYQKVSWPSLPSFPGESDPPEEYHHMKNVHSAMERYLYGQAFNCSYYWTIGENIKWSSAYKPAEHGAALNNVGLIKSLGELLEKFCGRDIHSILPYVNISLPKDDESRVVKVVSLLDSVVDYLMKLGASLGHFKAEDLLDFDDYEIYHRKMLEEKNTPSAHRKSSTANYDIICNPENLTKEKFEKRMVQYWLDLFLQLYKVSVLYSIKQHAYPQFAHKEDANKIHSKLASKDKMKSHLNKKRDSKGLHFRFISEDRSKSECILLTWLDVHYTRQKTVVWELDPPEIKSLDFFDCLSDSLVFAAVTSYFCPYISSKYFGNMFTHPKGKDQLYHNAICLLKAWNNIRLGIIVHASELIDDHNCILKLMIAVHLFKVLPSYVPEAVLDFGTPLTTCKELPITLTNSTLLQFNYHLIIIGDPYQSFVLKSPSSHVFSIKSKRSVTINIQYTSNKIKKESATILFCGCCVPPHFAPNRVFTLEGYAQELKISKVFHLEAPLNRIVDKTIKMNAPYGTHVEEYEFELWHSAKKPSIDDPSPYVPWIEISNRKLPQRLHFPYKTIFVPGMGRKTKEFSIKVCCFTPKQYDYYFILMNPSLGDFIIQISIKAKVNVEKEPIQLHFDDNVHNIIGYKERYSDFWAKYSQTTPPNAVIKIPYRNDDLWSSLMAMYKLKFDDKENAFWTSYLETNIGLRLIQWMMGNQRDAMTDEVSHIFHSCVNYKVSCSSQLLIVSPALQLSDIKIKGTVDFPVYVSKDDISSLNNIKISLTAEHGNEIRVYRIMYNENKV